VLVTKSTVPVGTGDKIEAIMRQHARHEFAVAANPSSSRRATRSTTS